MDPVSSTNEIPQRLRCYQRDDVSGKMVEVEPMTQQQYEELSKQAAEGLMLDCTPKCILRMAGSKKA